MWYVYVQFSADGLLLHTHCSSTYVCLYSVSNFSLLLRMYSECDDLVQAHCCVGVNEEEVIER